MACGGDLGFETLDELHEEMARLWSPRDAVDAPPGAWMVAGADGRAPARHLPAARRRGPDALGRADVVTRRSKSRAFAEVHPDDAAAIGIADGGGRDRAHGRRARPTLPLRVTTNVAPGSVFVPFNQPGLAANTLLDGSWTTAVTLEPAEPIEPAEPAEAVAVGEDAS